MKQTKLKQDKKMRSFTLFQKQKEKKGQPAGRIHVDPFFLGFKKKKKKKKTYPHYMLTT